MNTTAPSIAPFPSADPNVGWEGFEPGERVSDFANFQLGETYLIKTRGVGEFPKVWAHNVVEVTKDFRVEGPFPLNRPLVYTRFTGPRSGTQEMAVWDFIFDEMITFKAVRK